MSHRGGGCWLQCKYRGGIFVMLFAFAVSAPAGSTFEFVAHNGFEACWSTAKDKNTLGALILDYIEGAPGCIAANSSYCYSTVCSVGQAGCPTVLHGSLAQYAQGQSRFDVQGGLDSIAGKIMVPLIGECDFSIDTSNVTLDYPILYSALPEYGLVPDGNNGYYQTAVQIGSVNVSGLTGGAVNVSGNIACAAANIGLAVFSSMLADVGPSIETVVQPTLDYAWCPWPF